MLRRGIIVVSALIIGIVALLAASGLGGSPPVYIWVAVEAAILLIAVVAERGRYRPPTSGGDHNWQRTAERFQDPTTGQWLVVEYNGRTGERRYVSEEPAQ